MASVSEPVGFSLVSEEWIPVLDLGGRQREVSLSDLFAQAHTLRTIACELPTQTFAILRLALAILHAATDGPAGEDAWRRMWNSSCLPESAVEYLESHRDRFDILHPQHPFYQVADLQNSRNETFGLEKIIADVPNGHPYLTSRTGPGLERISVAEAARWLVHCQAFDPSGIKTGAVGDERVTGGRGYPIGVGSAGSLGGVYLEGSTLRETMLLNVIPTGPGLLPRDDRDLPVWERDPHGPAEESAVTRGPFGVLSLYTWQSRRLRLYGDRDGIIGAMVSNGDKIEWQDLHLLEPLSFWGRSGPRETRLKQTPVYLPRPHDHTKALWRGLATLLPPPTSTNKEPAQRLPPSVMQWLARLSVRGVLDERYQVSPRAVSAIYGGKQAVIDQLFSDAVTMNVTLAQHESPLRAAAIDSAEDAENSVKALRILASDLIRASAGSGTDNGAADRAAEAAYGSLDQQFRQWLANLSPASDATRERTKWQHIVRRIVVRLGADLVSNAGPRAWAGREILDRNGKQVHYSSPQAEARFRIALRKALPLTAPPPTSTQEEETT